MYWLYISYIVAKMYIQRIDKKTKNKTYTSVYLVENYRENGKVKHRLISNLSKWSDELVAGLKKILKGETIDQVSDLHLSQGKSFAALTVFSELSKKLGIKQALGNTRQGKLALFQILGRIISHSSRNYMANEWAKGQAVDSILKLETFNEDDLYENLDWLCNNQSRIEKDIFSFRHNTRAISEIFLYDVTSSYFEGSQNELSAFGYNRDKKKGKKQIVIGLLTDSEGYPLTIEVFKGNTSDTQTVSNQLEKLQKTFGVERVIFVGDKGMIKSSQISELNSDKYKWNYLTTITKEQIKTLINKDVIQLDLFEDELIEVEVEEGIRYILRRNPVRATELQTIRQSKIDHINSYVKEQNTYLKDHKKAHSELAIKRVQAKINKLKLKNILIIGLNERVIEVQTDTEKIKAEARLDGCYVVKTNVPKESLDTKTAHDRYKNLADVEFAFRTMKTTLENIRPIFVRKENRTRGHVFVAMLAYMIIKYMTDTLSSLNYTRAFIIDSLDKISYLEYTYKGKTMSVVPQNLLPHQKEIINTLKIKLK